MLQAVVPVVVIVSCSVRIIGCPHHPSVIVMQGFGRGARAAAALRVSFNLTEPVVAE